MKGHGINAYIMVRSKGRVRHLGSSKADTNENGVLGLLRKHLNLTYIINIPVLRFNLLDITLYDIQKAGTVSLPS